MSDIAERANSIANCFRWFANEYHELRRANGNLLDHMYLTTRLIHLITDAAKEKVLPNDIQDRADVILRERPDCPALIALRLIGYKTFVERPGLVDDLLPPDEFTLFNLMPGWIGDIWPDYFKPISYLRTVKTDEYREMIYKCKKENFFEYVGLHAKLCELLAENAEQALPRTDGLKIPGFLDRTNALFQWNDKTYEWLTETMMDALELLLKRYPDKVKPSEMTNKIGRLPEGGFRKVFKTNRGRKIGVHPVVEIVGGRSPAGWYLIK